MVCALSEAIPDGLELMSENLFDLIGTHDPAKTLIRTPDGRKITYGEMERGTARLANLLLSLGVGPGDRVAAQVEKSPEAIQIYLACLRAGAVYLPLNTACAQGELEYFFGDAQPRVVVCDPDRCAALWLIPALP